MSSSENNPQYQTDDDQLSRSTAVEQSSDVGNAVTQSPGEVVLGIPAYNEAATIGPVVTAARRYVDTVLVVDDGSTDETVAVATEAGARVIEHERNRGYGGALKSLFEAASEREASHLVILDADGQHDVNDIPTILEKQQSSGAEIVVGSRFTGEKQSRIPLYRVLGLNTITLLMNFAFKYVYGASGVTDTQCGFRAYDRTAIKSIAADDSIGEHMGASVDILLHAANAKFDIAEIPTNVNYDVDDASTHNPLIHGLMVVTNLFRTVVRDRPIRTLGYPGLISFLLGAVTISLVQTGQLSLSSGMQMTQSLLILCGLLLTSGAALLKALLPRVNKG